MDKRPTEAAGRSSAAGPRRRASEWQSAGNAISLGMNMVTGMAVCAGLGYWIDHRREGNGLFWTVCGLLTGFCWGLYEMWKTVRGMTPDSEQEASRDRDGSGSNGDNDAKTESPVTNKKRPIEKAHGVE